MPDPIPGAALPAAENPPASPPSPSPAPAGPNTPPAPAPPAAGASSAPSAAPAPAPDLRNLPPESLASMEIEWEGPQGPSRATIAELVQARMESSQIPPEQVEAFKEFQKALAGDKAATARLLGLGPETPEAGTPSGPPATDRDTELLQRIEALEGRAETLSRPIREINQLQQVAGARKIIESQQAAVPYLSHHPEAAQLLLDTVTEVEGDLRSAGQDPARMSPQMQREVLAESLRRANTKCRRFAEVYADFQPTDAEGAASGNPGAAVLDDQPAQRGDQTPGRHEAGVRIVNGRFVDAGGAPVVQTGTGDLVAGRIPDVNGAGAAPPVAPPETPGAPLTRAVLARKIDARLQEMNAHE